MSYIRDRLAITPGTGLHGKFLLGFGVKISFRLYMLQDGYLMIIMLILLAQLHLLSPAEI